MDFDGKKKQVIVLGASDAARMCAYILGLDKRYEVAGFIDNEQADCRQQISDLPIIGDDDDLHAVYESGIRAAVIGVGVPRIRSRLRKQLESIGFELVQAVHPTAIITPEVKMSESTIVLPGAILADNPQIDVNVFIGQGAVIGHGARVGSDSLVGGRSAIGADVVVGETVLVGWGAVIAPRCKVGARSIVGVGATVLSDVPENAVVIGNPAKVVKYNVET